MELSPEFKKMKAAFEAKEPKRTTRGLPAAEYMLPGQSKSILAEGTTPKLNLPPSLRCTVPTAGKKVKHVFIEATFPELKGGASRQSAHGEASGTKPAIARAFKNLLKTIPKKRISVISAKISITTKIVEG